MAAGTLGGSARYFDFVPAPRAPLSDHAAANHSAMEHKKRWTMVLLRPRLIAIARRASFGKAERKLEINFGSAIILNRRQRCDAFTPPASAPLRWCRHDARMGQHLAHQARQGSIGNLLRRKPPHSVGRAPFHGARPREDLELQREIHQDVINHAAIRRHATASATPRRGASASAPVTSKAGCHSVVGTWSCRREGRARRAGAPARGRPRGWRHTRRRAANALPASSRVAKAFAVPACRRRARFDERTQHAGRSFRRADGRAEIHHRLRVVAGAMRRAQRRGPLANQGLAPGNGARWRRRARSHARHCRRRTARLHESDRRHRRRRVGAEAGQRAQRRLRPGTPAARSTTACAQACRLRARA